MTGTQLAALIRRRTKTNSTTYTDANLLIDVNLMKDELAAKIQQSRQKIWNIPTLLNLEADRREYAFPADIINNMDNLELKFSDSVDFVTAEFVARRHYRDALQESKIITNFDNLEPKYFIRRKAIYILSGTITAVTEGFKLVYNAFPADLANLTGTTDLSVDPSTTTHGFPREFHDLWSRRVQIEYKDKNHIKLSKKELDYDKDLKETLEEFSTLDASKEIIGEVPPGKDRGNNGYDY